MMKLVNTDHPSCESKQQIKHIQRYHRLDPLEAKYADDSLSENFSYRQAQHQPHKKASRCDCSVVRDHSQPTVARPEPGQNRLHDARTSARSLK